MVKLKKGGIRTAEIPSSSMADIAFLLLLFFLVSTVIDVDTGIGMNLPEYVPIEEQELVPLSKDRLASLLINENGDVLLDKNVIAVPQIKKVLIPRIESKIDLPKNKKLVVSVKTDRKTNYNLYIQAIDQVKGAYADVKEAYAKANWGKDILEISEDQKNELKEKIPIIISIAEPEKIK
ncbi:MAG: biopolymer transporter ExbD [Ignavibacteriae bacterium HGW-Ignavibacteriae-2]|jgi:biopolymer transport protein ExbD|nr:biopolymer transporter ExbD [Bacteroidota bacterium]PKL87689.1 MAG: biopolymer transporter ExbD [Ignavibacteriae bacterium HGW-Ignavibacteriae-2]